jgi:hypothetical protein
VGIVLLFAAAICHAGMAALPDGTPALKGLPARPSSEATASVPVEEAGFGALLSFDAVVSLAGALLVSEGPACGMLVPGMRPIGRVFVVGDGEGFILWPMSFFKLFSSEFSSSNRASVDSFWLCIAFGMRSFRPRTSSPIRRDSSSRLRFEAFSSPITLSTSVNAESRRSVRACSDALRASVSFAS